MIRRRVPRASQKGELTSNAGSHVTADDVPAPSVPTVILRNHCELSISAQLPSLHGIKDTSVSQRVVTCNTISETISFRFPDQ